MKNEAERVAVIGGGPAGIAGAVQLTRHGLRPILFEPGPLGGLLRDAWLVENYPGFPKGITGPELADLMAEQLRGAAVEVREEEVTSLRTARLGAHDQGARRSAEPGRGASGLLAVETRSGTFEAGSAIVATGTRSVPDHGIGIAPAAAPRVFRSGRRLRGAGGARIAVVGGGDAAFDYALGLSEGNEVTVFVRSERARCIPLLLERAGDAKGLTIRWRTSVASIEEVHGERLSLTCETDGSDSQFACDYVIIAVGREPALAFLPRELHGGGENVLLAGDVASGAHRQASIAVGQGVTAAMRIAALARRSGAQLQRHG